MRSFIYLLLSLVLCSRCSLGFQQKKQVHRPNNGLKQYPVGRQINASIKKPPVLSASNSAKKVYVSDKVRASSSAFTAKSILTIMKNYDRELKQGNPSQSKVIQNKIRFDTSVNTKPFHRSMKLSNDVDNIQTNRKSIKLGRSALNRIENFSRVGGKSENIKSEIAVDDLQAVSRMGLNFDDCRNSGDCRGGRECVRPIGDDLFLCPPGDNCFCAPLPGGFACQSNRDCVRGEVCARINGEGRSLCFSRTSLEITSGLGIPVSSGSGSNSGNNGLNFDICRTGGDCRGGRECGEFIGDDLFRCPPGDNCFCVPLPGGFLCGSNRDCAGGEVCVRLDGEGDAGCASRTSPVVLSGTGIPV